MLKPTKKWLITATLLVAVGLAIFATVMTVYGWDFTRLNTTKLETNTYTVKEDFKSISINTNTADVVFVISEDETCKVVCYEYEKTKHKVDAVDGTLYIRLNNEREWYDYIGINFGTPKITVYLPEADYTSLVINANTGDTVIPKQLRFGSVDIYLSTGSVKNYASATGEVKIKTSTGSIYLEDLTTGSLDLSVTTGDINLNNVKCKSFSAEAGTGDVDCHSVIAEEKLSVSLSTGDVILNACDAAEVYVETSTGDVNGSFLTDKVYITETSTGDIRVPKTITGGRCEIITNTGDIEIKEIFHE